MDRFTDGWKDGQSNGQTKLTKTIYPLGILRLPRGIMSTHNIRFYGEIYPRTIIKYSSLTSPLNYPKLSGLWIILNYHHNYHLIRATSSLEIKVNTFAKASKNSNSQHNSLSEWTSQPFEAFHPENKTRHFLPTTSLGDNLCKMASPISKTRGPRATGRSPEWHSYCRYADVMQHFSNPVIATNEKFII